MNTHACLACGAPVVTLQQREGRPVVAQEIGTIYALSSRPGDPVLEPFTPQPKEIVGRIFIDHYETCPMGKRLEALSDGRREPDESVGDPAQAADDAATARPRKRRHSAKTFLSKRK